MKSAKAGAVLNEDNMKDFLKLLTAVCAMIGFVYAINISLLATFVGILIGGSIVSLFHDDDTQI